MCTTVPIVWHLWFYNNFQFIDLRSNSRRLSAQCRDLIGINTTTHLTSFNFSRFQPWSLRMLQVCIIQNLMVRFLYVGYSN